MSRDPTPLLPASPVRAEDSLAAQAQDRQDLMSRIHPQIGLIVLIGLAAKDAILTVEFAKDEFEKGQGLEDAAVTGARLRLRPVLMISFAFILGCVPLALASGAGAIARQVMGTGVIGGMLAATCIGIFIIPMMFYVIERLAHRGPKEH